MKTTKIIFGIFVMLCAFWLTGCEDKIEKTQTYTANVPVYLPYSEMRAPIQFKTSEPLQNPGKIYFKDNYLFLNDLYKGIHIYDNSNTSNPVYKGFISIVGNVDMAIKGNVLYADNGVDLIAMNISDPTNPQLVDRVENAFLNVVPMVDQNYPVCAIDKSKGLVISWKLEQVTEKVEITNYYPMYAYDKGIAFTNAVSNTGGASPMATGSISPNFTGRGGSLARFLTYENTLYTLNSYTSLKIYDVTNSGKIVKGDSIQTWRNMETIFADNNSRLFVGSTTGMLIYDIKDASHPIQLSEYNHITSCDPVVVDGNLAYITLRGGTRCNNNLNLLEVIDITDITKPVLLKSYPMFNPYGLGIVNKTLFVCDGTSGLKVYNASDNMKITDNIIATFSNVQAYDVIPLEDVTIMVGSDGVYQYSFENPTSIKLLSKITAVKSVK